jgi:kinesin family protein 11
MAVLSKTILAIYSETPFIPYRDSKLTRLLQNSMTDSSYMTVLAHLNPSECYYEESLKTLQYVNRSRNTEIAPIIQYVQ